RLAVRVLEADGRRHAMSSRVPPPMGGDCGFPVGVARPEFSLLRMQNSYAHMPDLLYEHAAPQTIG
ncbi:MAG: hypothetical protein LCH99_03265, partial [Proteobacteria bacterium]|nr:hypothetical protein [Pseudomonadota bacterium]